MDPITLLVVIVGFLLLKGGALSQFGVGGSSGNPPQGFAFTPAANTSSQYIGQESQQISRGIGVGVNAIEGAVQAGTSLAKAIPIVGAVIGAISDALFAASAKRAAAARDENSALVTAVPGFDSAIKQVVTAYNSGQITAAQTSQLLDQVMSNYWSEVGPHIQSGRNGCSNGSNCPGSIALDYCSGAVGAACCVGCAALQLAVNNINAALVVTSKNGAAATANVPTVYPSKYGGISRAQYSITVQRPSSGFML